MKKIVISQSTTLNAVKGLAHAFGGIGFDAAKGEGVPDVVRTLGVPPEKLVYLRQVHGRRVLLIDEKNQRDMIGQEGDGLISATVDTGALIFTADCLPVIIADPHMPAFMILHGGWRGLAGGIIEEGLERFMDLTGRCGRELVAAVGPGASRCCYEVGMDVVGQFPHLPPGSFDEKKGLKGMLDLKWIAQKILVGGGLLSENIDVRPECSVCDGNYHSFRRNPHLSWRQVTVVYLSCMDS